MQALVFGSLAVALFLFVTVSFSNLPLLWGLGSSGALSVSLIVSLFGALFTNMTPTMAVIMVMNSVLFGGLITLFVLKGMGFQKGMSAWGAGLSLFGSGCASCGAVLGGVWSLFGGGVFLATLPMGGAEFSLLGTVFLGMAFWRLYKAKKVTGVCAIDEILDKA